MENRWKFKQKQLLPAGRTLVMGILNVTPDSFSDGGEYSNVDLAVARALQMEAEGADIIDVGGESTRPGSSPVSPDEELTRVIPVIEEIAPKLSIPVSIDTTKCEVARKALEAGAQIVNDISGLRFDPSIAGITKEYDAGLILMHSRGSIGAMHGLSPVEDIMSDLFEAFRASIDTALKHGMERSSLVLDPGIGFGKTDAQNLELIAKIDLIQMEFPGIPVLIGTSNKSFIGRLLGNIPARERGFGTMATLAAAVIKGANIVRVHDVKAAVHTVRVIDSIERQLIY
jgi:dihydropteroate synthase